MNQARATALIGLGIIIAFSRCNAGDATVWKTDAPQTSAQVAAEGHIPLPWPSGAKAIQYVNYTGADGRVVQLVRFEAPLDFSRRFASRWFLNRIGFPTAPARRGTPAPAAAFDATLAASLAKQAAGGIPAEARVTWFDTDKIQHGQLYGVPGKGPLFLIDTDRAILYYWFVN